MACSGAFGVPDTTRTCDPGLRRLVLYPTELLGHISKIFNFPPPTDSNELPLRRRSLYPTELRAHKNLLYFNASCPFCQRRSSANTTNARSFRTGRLWEEGDNTKGDRAPACRLAGMSGGLLYRGSDGNGGQRPPSGPRPRLSALDLSAASRRLSGKPCRPGRAGTEWIRTGSQITPRPCPAC